MVHLHFLRKLALGPGQHDEFIHAAHECYIPQLEEMVCDVPSIRLVRIEDRVPESRNVWKNAGAGTPAGGFWERHALRHDFGSFHLDWFDHLAKEMLGCLSPIHKTSDLLFDFPAMLGTNERREGAKLAQECDFLIVNSQPCSGQFLAFDDVHCMDGLIAEIAARHAVCCTAPTKVPNVPCTLDYGFTLADIGWLSRRCRHILGVATGPLWPTFNVWNRDTAQSRVVLIDNGERLDLTFDTFHARTLEEARHFFKTQGIL